MTSISVLHSWNRIHAWLALNAPQVLASLSSGATEAQIAALEARIGARLPDDARLSFAIHDGSGGKGLIDGNELLSLEHAAGEWEFWVDFVQSGQAGDFQAEPGAGVRGGWFREGWIPLSYDGAGDHACLDLDPDEGGWRGQIIEFWHDANDRKVVAPSFEAWLSQFADDLERGLYKLGATGQRLE